MKPGELIRQTRQAKGLTLAELGKQTGYSAAQVSRYERGISPMADIDVLRCFADALELPHQAFGLAPPAPRPEVRHGQQIGATSTFPRLPTSRVGRSDREDGEDPVRRRKLLAGLAATAASAAGAPLLGNRTGQADEALLGELLVARLRDAMLGLGPAPTIPPAEQLSADFTRALADFDACRYASLVVRLPRLIRAGHALTAGGDDTAQYALLAKSYLLATRMLVKMDEQQSAGWRPTAHGSSPRQHKTSSPSPNPPANWQFLPGKQGGIPRHCRSRCPRPTTRICAAPGGPGPRYAAFWCRAPVTPWRAGATGTGCGS
ncbi:helix-turn-helix transcriptional regulator [Streptomyces noursei]|uniref:helix-turn-helix domain-containing protein n=1 Tax=Streptomyces noursei TaxID=1971 RepID=UPI0033271B98